MPLTCNEFIDFLIDYYEGNLPDEQRQLFETHMDVCPDCVNYLDSYKKTVQIVQETMADSNAELDAEVPPGLVDAILAAKNSR